MKELNDKVALVTGGARDIGKAISIALAEAGAKVAVNYFGSKAHAEETVEEIKKNGGEAIAVFADVTKEGDINAMLKTMEAAFGKRVDILVNNAGGLFARKTIEEADGAFFDKVINTNFKSAFLVTKAVKPHLEEGSVVVNMASQAGRDGGGPGSGLYAASKGAIMTYTRALAKEFGPQGIRVNSICPGMIATKFHDDFTASEVRSKVAAGTPLRREGNAAEVADLVIYLASNKSSFIQGVNFDINGGLAFS